ncbi:hypothetical protein GQ53DRAFT_439717 [Thozetella sp. PMI_491]|nr:hypothetical protein GQ53DRAFT_439717 [Thozetella sp. PMI_491]
MAWRFGTLAGRFAACLLLPRMYSIMQLYPQMMLPRKTLVMKSSIPAEPPYTAASLPVSPRPPAPLPGRKKKGMGGGGGGVAKISD